MDLFENLSSYLSQIEINKLKLSLQDKSYKGVLLNTRLMDDDSFIKLFPMMEKHPIVEHAYIYNKKDIDLAKSIYYELGCFYLQEPSSMIPAYLLNVEPSDNILDLCSAPGGKSIQLSFKLKNRGMIISNDISYQRDKKTIDNLDRLGISNITVTNNDFSKIYINFIDFFDKIVLDAPCSGSGMFRKDEEIRKDWSFNKVLKYSSIQKELILMCYKMLKPGGQMIYSTCSFSFEEDEEIIDYLLKNSDAELVEISNNDYFYVSNKVPYGIHLFPFKFKGEGQYACLLKKPGTDNKINLINDEYKKQNIAKNVITNKNLKLLKIDNNFLDAYIFNDYLYCCYKTLNPKYLKWLNILHCGVKIGKIIKSNLFKYDFSFARGEINIKNIETIELNIKEAEEIINGNSISTNKKEGIYLIRFNKYNLCFAKSDGRVLKNWYYKPAYQKKY